MRSPVLPWHSSTSVRAGLPTERAAWLAVVLPVVARADSHVATLAALPTTRTVPRSTWLTWWRWLATEHAEGRLPEWQVLTGTETLPERPEGGARGVLRGAAKARHERKVARGR